jgi:serine/threonine protein kinase
MSATMFEVDELSLATDGFSDQWLLGTGDAGSSVYGAVLEGRAVAVKVVLPSASRAVASDGLLAALAAAGRVRHENLLELVGVAVGTAESPPCVVTPLMRGGSLLERLARASAQDPPLTALQRVGCVLGAARALAALHAAGLPHRRVKSANVLLDDAYLALSEAAKLADAGMPPALCAPVDAATDGYLDPEWARKVCSAPPQFARPTRCACIRPS